MRVVDVAVAMATLAVGAWAGAQLAGTAGGVVGGVVGAVVGAVIGLAGIRLAVAVPVVAGTVAGGMLGKGIVHALCVPRSCHGGEVAAALVTGAGALVGIGLVAALVMRSFDEYRQTRSGDKERGTPPQEGGEGVSGGRR